MKMKMSGKSSSEFQWTNNEIHLLLEITQAQKLDKITRSITRNPSKTNMTDCEN